jgi:hypothetical protein
MNNALMDTICKIQCTNMVLFARDVFGEQKKSPAGWLRQAIN